MIYPVWRYEERTVNIDSQLAYVYNI